MVKWNKGRYTIQAYYLNDISKRRYLKSYMWKCNTCNIIGEHSFDSYLYTNKQKRMGHPFQRCLRGILNHSKKYHADAYEKWKAGK